MSECAKVLVIDDEAAVRQSIAAYLEDSGFETVQAGDGRAGVACIGRDNPDVVLCDLRMPGMDGMDVLEWVERERVETPILVVSGLGGLGDAIKALKLGAWDYITKPIQDMAVLEHAVRQALERADLIRQNRVYREHLEQVNERLEESLRRLEDDEQAGRRIQFQLMPPDQRTIGGFHFTREVLTSTYLSGDFVDYFSIDSGHVGFYIADVSGHGVSSALVTLMLNNYMNRLLEGYRQFGKTAILNPAVALEKLNRATLRANIGKYLTILYGVFDLERDSLRISNAGQFPFPILFDGASPTYIERKSMPVGLFDYAEFDEQEIALPEQFALAMFSDGILEVLAEPSMDAKERYLMEAVDRIDPNAAVLARRLGLEAGQDFPDDVTLLLVTRQDGAR